MFFIVLKILKLNLRSQRTTKPALLGSTAVFFMKDGKNAPISSGLQKGAVIINKLFITKNENGNKNELQGNF